MPPLIIGFEGRAVAVEAGAAAIRAYLERRFARLAVEAPPAAGAARVVVRPEGAGFRIEGRPELHGYPQILGPVEYEILNALIEAHTELLWLHAGAAAREGRAVLFCGPTCCGKSTLTLGLCERGWRFLSDDMAPVEMEGRRILPFPRTPWKRLAGGGAGELTREQMDRLNKQELPLSEGMLQREGAGLAMLIFPVWRAGAPAAAERTAGTAIAMELAARAVNFSAHGLAALTFFSALARETPAWRVYYPEAGEGVALVEKLWRQGAGNAECGMRNAE